MRLPESLMSPNRPKIVSNINRILINALPAATVHLDVLCVHVCVSVCTVWFLFREIQLHKCVTLAVLQQVYLLLIHWSMMLLCL